MRALVKALEHALLLVGRDTRARVAHREGERVRGLRRGQFGREVHLPPRGRMLERVAEQIGQDLLYFVGVQEQVQGRGQVGGAVERHAPLGGQRVELRHHPAQKRGHEGRCGKYLQPTGLQLGQVQDAVHQRLQAPGLAVGQHHGGAQRGRQGLGRVREQGVERAQHQGQGRAQLVADVSKELVFGHIQFAQPHGLGCQLLLAGLQFAQRALQLVRALRHLPFQGFILLGQ